MTIEGIVFGCEMQEISAYDVRLKLSQQFPM